MASTPSPHFSLLPWRGNPCLYRVPPLAFFTFSRPTTLLLFERTSLFCPPHFSFFFISRPVSSFPFFQFSTLHDLSPPFPFPLLVLIFMCNSDARLCTSPLSKSKFFFAAVGCQRDDRAFLTHVSSFFFCPFACLTFSWGLMIDCLCASFGSCHSSLSSLSPYVMYSPLATPFV